MKTISQRFKAYALFYGFVDEACHFGLGYFRQGNDTLIKYAQGSVLLEDFTAIDLSTADFSFL